MKIQLKPSLSPSFWSLLLTVLSRILIWTNLGRELYDIQSLTLQLYLVTHQHFSTNFYHISLIFSTKSQEVCDIITQEEPTMYSNHTKKGFYPKKVDNDGVQAYRHQVSTKKKKIKRHIRTFLIPKQKLVYKPFLIWILFLQSTASQVEAFMAVLILCQTESGLMETADMKQRYLYFYYVILLF